MSKSLRNARSGFSSKLLLLGSGELGKEFVISAKRLGVEVVAVDSYAGAPAMQVSDAFEVINMLDGDALEAVVRKHRPDFIIPEVEAIRTNRLLQLEKEGFRVVPTAEAAHLTMNRDAIRELAATELGLRTARFAYAISAPELLAASKKIGFPCVIKPVMSSSGKGQSVVQSAAEVPKAWDFACSNMRGDQRKVIVEEFINFEYEITLLTVKQRGKGETIFVQPIGHRQERGDYMESWLPAEMKPALLKKAQAMAKKITDRLCRTKGGAGLFGVEFFITKDEVIFSELSPRPHDTGMVTLISQDLSEFDLHVRAVMGLPIGDINYYGPSASAVILAKEPSANVSYSGLDKVLANPNVQLRIFGKPSTRKFRRMGITLARSLDTTTARKVAAKAAGQLKIEYT